MANFLTPDPMIENAVRSKGEKLFALMDQQPPPALFSKKGAYARLMEWSMKDPVFKTQLFRFVDVLPSLDSSGEIVRHLQEYLGDKAVELNPALKAGLAAPGVNVIEVPVDADASLRSFRALAAVARDAASEAAHDAAGYSAHDADGNSAHNAAGDAARDGIAQATRAGLTTSAPRRSQ